MNSLILHGGCLVDHNSMMRADLWIEDGHIAGLLAPGEGLEFARSKKGVRLESAEGLYILPGLVDVHVHLREPGLEHKEDMTSGTGAAACAGVTTVLDMPNTIPPVLNKERLLQKMELAKDRVYVDIGFYGAVECDHVDNLSEMSDAGAIAFKLFLGPTTGNIKAPDRGALFNAFKKVADTGLPLVVHAEDAVINAYWEPIMRSRGDSYGNFIQSHPAYGEAVAAELAIRLAETTDVKLHIAHIGSLEMLSVLRAAKERNAPVTGETCPHYLGLSEADWPLVKNNLKVLPPIRSAYDSKGLWESVREGLIEVISTDHAPHLPEERAGKSIWDSPGGTAGLDTLLPLLLDWANKGRLTLCDVVKLCSTQPAKTFGLKGKGSLKPGTFADLVLVDMTQRMFIEGNLLQTRCKSTPFEGLEVQGVPISTYLRGKLIANQGELVKDKPSGRVLTS